MANAVVAGVTQAVTGKDSLQAGHLISDEKYYDGSKIDWGETTSGTWWTFFQWDEACTGIDVGGVGTSYVKGKLENCFDASGSKKICIRA